MIKIGLETINKGNNNIMLKYYTLKKETHVIGLTNSRFDLPMLKNHVKLGYVITEVAIPTKSQDSYGRGLYKNIILK